MFRGALHKPLINDGRGSGFERKCGCCCWDNQSACTNRAAYLQFSTPVVPLDLPFLLDQLFPCGDGMTLEEETATLVAFCDMHSRL